MCYVIKSFLQLLFKRKNEPALVSQEKPFGIRPGRWYGSVPVLVRAVHARQNRTTCVDGRQPSPDERAGLVLKEMTLEEKISLLHGTGMSGLEPAKSVGSVLERGRGICRRRFAAGNS